MKKLFMIMLVLGVAMMASQMMPVAWAQDEPGVQEVDEGGRKTYRCAYCGATFNKLYLVQKHIRTAHPEHSPWREFNIAAAGQGYVKCLKCSTANGCTTVVYRKGATVNCKAYGHNTKFSHWTINGNFAGDKNPRPGPEPKTTMTAHFE